MLQSRASIPRTNNVAWVSIPNVGASDPSREFSTQRRLPRWLGGDDGRFVGNVWGYEEVL